MADKKFKLLPTVKAEEEDLVDPYTTLREQCSQNPKAQNLLSRLQTCNDRVNSKSQTSETCLEELIDYVHFVDHCASHDLFTKLK